MSIGAIAHVAPPVVMPSAEIEARLAAVYERLRLPAGRLELMTGIRERRFWPAPALPSAIAAEAGAAALAAWGGDRSRLGWLAHCAVCRDRLEPATAAYVHRHLRLAPGCGFLDLSNACLGFLNGMMLAASLIEVGAIEAALLVSGEDGRPLLDWTLQHLLATPLDRDGIKPFFANLTIGAGAVAMVLCRPELAAPEAWRLVGGVALGDTAANELCQGGNAATGGYQMLTEAEALLEAGIRLATSTWARFQADLGPWPASGHTVCHQVGRAHQRQLQQALGLNPERDHVTYPWMGNTGSAACPFTLSDALARGALADGQPVALLGIGSGLGCLMLRLERPGPSPSL